MTTAIEASVNIHDGLAISLGLALASTETPNTRTTKSSFSSPTQSQCLSTRARRLPVVRGHIAESTRPGRWMVLGSHLTGEYRVQFVVLHMSVLHSCHGPPRVIDPIPSCDPAALKHFLDPTQVADECLLRAPEDSYSLANLIPADRAQERAQHRSHAGRHQKSGHVGRSEDLDDDECQGYQRDGKAG